MANELIPAAVMKTIAARYHHAAAVDGMKWAQEKQHFLSVIAKSADLKQATPESLQDAALQAASMGLSFNPLRQHVYMIPRRARKRKPGESDADYEKNVPIVAGASPGYRGLTHIATNDGVARFFRAQVVYKRDFFKYLGPADKPEYVGYTAADAPREEKDAIGVYALVKTKDGDWLCEYMDRATVLKVKAKSDNPKGLMWDAEKFWTEGWCKAVIRRLYKSIPQTSARMDAAIAAMDRHEGVIVDNQDNSPTDITQEVVQVINDEQANQLHAKLTDMGIEGEKATEWLNRVAFSVCGAQSITDLPADKFDEAMEKLLAGLAAYLAKKAKNAAKK